MIDTFYLDKEMMMKLLNEEKYNLIVSYIRKQYDTGEYNEELFPTLEKALIKSKKKKDLIQFWNHLITIKLHRFWRTFKHYNENIHNKKAKGLIGFFKKQEKVLNEKFITTEELLSINKRLLKENAKKNPKLNLIWDWYAIIGYIDKAIEQYEILDLTEEISQLKKVKEHIYNLKKPTDKRKMDETLFWELIEQSREVTGNNSQFLEIFKEKLEALNATEIKKFQKILLEKMESLNHWDVWALAYIIHEGCGDDSFDYFKVWVISKGQEAFESVKNMQIENLQKIFKEDSQLEEFMYVAHEVYFDKKFEDMPTPEIESQPIQGTMWDEEDICEQYPTLCKMFGY